MVIKNLTAQETPGNFRKLFLVDIQPGNTSRSQLEPLGLVCAAQERTVLNVQPQENDQDLEMEYTQQVKTQL